MNCPFINNHADTIFELKTSITCYLDILDKIGYGISITDPDLQCPISDLHHIKNGLLDKILIHIINLNLQIDQLTGNKKNTNDPMSPCVALESNLSSNSSQQQNANTSTFSFDKVFRWIRCVR